MGAVVSAAPVAQTVCGGGGGGQHGGRLPFLQELHFKTRVLLT